MGIILFTLVSNVIIRMCFLNAWMHARLDTGNKRGHIFITTALTFEGYRWALPDVLCFVKLVIGYPIFLLHSAGYWVINYAEQTYIKICMYQKELPAILSPKMLWLLGNVSLSIAINLVRFVLKNFKRESKSTVIRKKLRAADKSICDNIWW